MNKFILYFTKAYSDFDDHIRIKAGHTAFMLCLICLSVIIDISLNIILNRKTLTLTYLLTSLVAFSLFFVMLYLIRVGKLMITDNLFILAGSAKLLEYFGLEHLHEFYLQCFLFVIVCIAIYIKKYQLFISLFIIITMAILRIFYAQAAMSNHLDYKEQLLSQTYQASLAVIIFIMIAYFYDRIIINEIIKSRQLKTLSETDVLTLLYNRQKFNHIISELTSIENQYCLALIDIDFFKQINDKYGHQMGDQVLKEFATLLLENFNTSEMVFRWGGEEFAIISPNADLPERFIEKLENFRESIANNQFSVDKNITISIGLVCSNAYPNEEAIVICADHALYQAKNLGRNRLEIHEKEGM